MHCFDVTRKICLQLFFPPIKFEMTVLLHVMGQHKGFEGMQYLHVGVLHKPWFGFYELKAGMVLVLRFVAFCSKQNNMNQNFKSNFNLRVN